MAREWPAAPDDPGGRDTKPVSSGMKPALPTAPYATESPKPTRTEFEPLVVYFTPVTLESCSAPALTGSKTTYRAWLWWWWIGSTCRAGRCRTHPGTPAARAGLACRNPTNPGLAMNAACSRLCTFLLGTHESQIGGPAERRDVFLVGVRRPVLEDVEVLGDGLGGQLVVLVVVDNVFLDCG